MDIVQNCVSYGSVQLDRLLVISGTFGSYYFKFQWKRAVADLLWQYKASVYSSIESQIQSPFFPQSLYQASGPDAPEALLHLDPVLAPTPLTTCPIKPI
jgi:hypothetical protein